MKWPRVSVIILNWNGRDLLPTTLPSVVATDYPDFEVVLADNASTDGSADWVASAFPSVKLVRHPENWGFCRGNNEALPHADGAFVVLLNSDVETPRSWLRPLVRSMLGDSRIAAVQPKLLQYEDRDHFEYAGGAGGYLDRVGYPFTRGRLFFTLERDTGQFDRPADIFWGSGAALLLRRSALDEVGLLDETFYLHMEEIDLCWRLQRAGYRVVYEPGSSVYHIGGSTLPQGSPRKAYYNFRNSLLMLYKNLPPRLWRRTFPVRILLDTAAMIRALITGHPREASAILKAYAHAHRLKHRYQAQRPHTLPAHARLPYRGLVAVDYFLLRRTRFGDLPAGRFRSFEPAAESAPAEESK